MKLLGADSVSDVDDIVSVKRNFEGCGPTQWPPGAMQAPAVKAHNPKHRATSPNQVGPGDDGGANSVDEEEGRPRPTVVVDDLNSQGRPIPGGHAAGGEAGDEDMGVGHSFSVSSAPAFHKQRPRHADQKPVSDVNQEPPLAYTWPPESSRGPRC